MLAALAVFLSVARHDKPRSPAPDRPNVLYLMADDMRPQLGAYGIDYMHTPHLDKLAAEGLLFSFAYTQYAVCAPSRNSFLSGRRPDTIKCWNFKNHFRQVGPNWTAMPQYFKEHGYWTSAAGKIYHANLPPNFDPPSWTVVEEDVIPWTLCPGPHNNTNSTINNPNYCNPEHPEKPFDEERILQRGLKLLDHAEASGKPWFVGIGTHRPHWPWRAPPQFLELYPPAKDIPPAADPKPPTGVPPMACNYAGNMLEPAWHCPTCIVPPDHAQQYRRHYYAACSYVDNVMGRALEKLDQLGATNRTIVVFHADHGYQLGEHNEWEKFTNFELGTRVPLIIKVPWKAASRGHRTSVMAELVDIYRTLADLSGLGPVEEGVEGTSLAPLFDDPSGYPSAGDLAPIGGNSSPGGGNSSLRDKVALSQFARCCTNHTHGGPHPGYICKHCVGTPNTKFDFMGYSLRSPRGWRYTEWREWNGTTREANWEASGLKGVELYDHRGDDGADFGGWENVNLATNDSFAGQLEQLQVELRKAFKPHTGGKPEPET